jgi:hypothetical protein
MLRTVTCLSLLIACSAAAKDLTVNLEFAPQEGVHSESPDLPPSMLERSFALRVEDGRGVADAHTIGKGTDDDDETFSIASGSDVIAYIKDTLADLSQGWGLKTGAPADRILTVNVARFFVEESNKAVGSMYTSEVKLTWSLTDAKGTKLGQGSGSGSAHRYGRARSGDNCSEVLSDALKEAYGEVLSGAARGGSAPAASPEHKGSVEERLRKLDELLEKGLITKDEYKKKREEILKDV